LRTRRPRERAFALAILVASSGLVGAGCVGYLTGSYDSEMQRLHVIIAELEAKNAGLAEECIGLRRRLRESESEDQGGASTEGYQAAAARPASLASTPEDNGADAPRTGE